MNFKHTTNIQIRFNDIDVAGHVYNAIYQDYFDLARISYFKDVLGSLINWKEIGFVIASIQIDYLSPILLNDNIFIQSNVSAVGEKSIEMLQVVMKEGETEPMASGKTILVCFDLQNRNSIEIPAKWVRKLSESEKL